ncbi:MAG: hypothetical protein WCY09_02270 [Candidatus Omnitrophota bacterium]
MKIKWLIILSTLLIGIIFISTLLTRTGNINPQLLPNEPTKSTPTENYSPAPLPPLATTPQPLVIKSGVIVINAPSKNTGDQLPPVQNDQGLEKTPEANAKVNLTPDSSLTIEKNMPAGITKIGKRPTPKETKEMNQAGVIMY